MQINSPVSTAMSTGGTTTNQIGSSTMGQVGIMGTGVTTTTGGNIGGSTIGNTNTMSMIGSMTTNTMSTTNSNIKTNTNNNLMTNSMFSQTQINSGTNNQKGQDSNGFGNTCPPCKSYEYCSNGSCITQNTPSAVVQTVKIFNAYDDTSSANCNFLF